MEGTFIPKSDKVITYENLGDIVEIKYMEKGIISKKGIIRIETTRKKPEFSGPREAILVC